jgi:hypothetical protein
MAKVLVIVNGQTIETDQVTVVAAEDYEDHEVEMHFNFTHEGVIVDRVIDNQIDGEFSNTYEDFESLLK